MTTEFTELRIYADGGWRVVGAEHDIVTELHTAAGAEAWDVLGASEADTLAWLAATANPGAAAALLRTDDEGKVTLEGLAVGRVGSSLIPALTDTYDVGSSLLWWREGYISQLNAVLFAEEQISLMGGWLMVPPDAGNLAGDVAPAATEVDFGKAMTPGHLILIWAKDAGGSAKKEYMEVGALVSGTTYNVTRDLAAAHGTDPAWSAGTPFCVLGTNGSGRIEINAYDTPRISVVTQGAAYNVQTEVLRLGDLAGIDDPVLSPSGWGLYGQNVFLSGKIVAQTGSIGGWTIADGHLYAGSDGTRAGLQPATYPFYAGSETPASAPFRVTPAGALVATSATITGTITATGGSFSGELSIGAAGGIWQGSAGTFASPNTGFKLYQSSSRGIWETWSGGSKQVYIDPSDMSLMAGGTAIKLSAAGMRLTGSSTSPSDPTFISWHQAGGTRDAEMGMIYSGSTPSHFWIHAFAGDLKLSAGQGTVIVDTSLSCSGNTKIGTVASALSNGHLGVQVDARIGGGLYVGATNVDPAAGAITATGTITGNIIQSNDYMTAPGGVHVGGTSDPGTDRLIVDGHTRIGLGLNVGTTGSDAPATGWGQFSGGIYINDTANANQTKGLTINQGSATDEILAFKSSLTHGITDVTETDTYGGVKLSSSSGAGMDVYGLSKATVALRLTGISTTADTGWGSAKVAPIVLGSHKKSGTSVTAFSINDAILVVRNAGSTVAIVGGAGQVYLGDALSESLWDDHDDMALLAGVRAAAVPSLRERFGEFARQARPILEATGVARFEADGRPWFSVTGLQMLTIDALRQFAARTEARLARYERELLRLGADPRALLN